MTMILTVWLLVAGQLMEGMGEVPAGVDCGLTAALVAELNDATLVSWECVLEVPA